MSVLLWCLELKVDSLDVDGRRDRDGWNRRKRMVDSRASFTGLGSLGSYRESRKGTPAGGGLLLKLDAHTSGNKCGRSRLWKSRRDPLLVVDASFSGDREVARDAALAEMISEVVAEGRVDEEKVGRVLALVVVLLLEVEIDGCKNCSCQ